MNWEIILWTYVTLYGCVVGIEEETVNVEIAKGAIMKIDRFAIQTIIK